MLKYLLICFLVVGAVVAAPKRPNVAKSKVNDDSWWKNSKATLLSSRSFDAGVGKERYAFIQFCSLTSAECKASTPEYDKLAEMYSGATPKRADLLVGRTDAWTFNSLSQTYNIKNFPTYRFFNKGKNTEDIEYSGEQTAEKMSAWIEEQIKLAEAAAKPAEEKKAEEPKVEEKKVEEKKTEEKKAEEPKKEEKVPEEPKEEPVAETKQAEPEPVKTTTEEKKTKNTEDDSKKELKVTFNTTLLQSQFDEVQKQLNQLKDTLQQSITENFKKVETLGQNFENHKQEFASFADKLKGHGDKIKEIGSSMDTYKNEIQKAVTSHAEKHFDTLKDNVKSIKDKVHEKVKVAPEGPGMMQNIMFMVVGGAVGGIAMFFLSSGGNKKRGYLD